MPNSVTERSNEKVSPLIRQRPRHNGYSGDAADFILGLTVDSLNGVRNRSTTAGAAREADPDFFRVLELMREVQAAGAFGMRVEDEKTKGSTAVCSSAVTTCPLRSLEKAAETDHHPGAVRSTPYPTPHSSFRNCIAGQPHTARR